MRSAIVVVILLSVLPIKLMGGPAGDYVGLTRGEKWIYEGIEKDSSFSYPSWSVTVDTIPYDSLVVSNFFDLDGKEAYERRSFRTHSDGSTNQLVDTLYENGSEIWMKYLIFTIDTAFRAYITPISVGDSWDMGIGGAYTGDFDTDGTPDTIFISHDTTYVLSQDLFTVPAGTYNAYEVYRKVRAEARLSSGFHSIEWMFRYERFVPDLGIIFDSTVTVDTTEGFESHWGFEVSRLLAYTSIFENLHTNESFKGKTIITDVPTISVKEIVEGTLYRTDGSVVCRNVNGNVFLLKRGVYFLRGKDKEHSTVSVRIIYR